MSKKNIRICEYLEREMSKYKLWADMIPEGSFFKNLRAVFSRKDWDTIRKAVYKKDGNKFSICGAKNDRLEAHEEWKYYYRKTIQKLESINALCFWCHRNKHLGQAFIMVDEGKLDGEKLISHWGVINDRPRESFRGYVIKALRLWKLRNKFNWIIVDNKGGKIDKGAEISSVLELIANKSEKS